METVLKYPGAKQRIADWIIQNMPEHEVYLEPYFGSGAVFFSKTPVKIETLNDINGDIYNYFRVIRENAAALAKQIEMTPYSREEYEKCFKEISDDDDPIEQARKFAVRCWFGFGSSNVYKNGFRSSQSRRSPQTTKQWNVLPDRILRSAERLKNAQIERLDAIELIRRYDTPDVFIYLDPPYLPGIRKSHLYKQEMTEEQHVELLKEIKEHPARIMISGYENDLYNSMLSGWEKKQKKTTAEKGIRRTETIWMNYKQEIQLTMI